MTEQEWLTRRRRIDPRLAAAGWEVRPTPGFESGPGVTCALAEYPTENGPADYALWSRGRVIGFVEAKRVGSGSVEDLRQAERYSQGLNAGPFNFGGFRVPFLYSTNGELIWFRDARHPMNRSREVAGFHAPAALDEMLAADPIARAEELLRTPNDHPWLRPYQRDANEATERAIADRRRKMLLAMATGTGKTFTLVNQVYRLMKTGVARRILFLVDRRALAAQAVRAFASFEAAPGLKFDAIYETYSQRFRREDLGDTRARSDIPDDVTRPRSE